jgi:uncharacterized membrane protein
MDQEQWGMKIAQSPWRWGLFLVAGLMLLGWILNTPPGIFGKADAIGYAVCHRIDARSFHLVDRQLPLCARCSGQYLGALFGIIFLISKGPRRVGTPPWPVITVLILFVVAYGIDGLNSYLHLSPMLEMAPSLPRLYEPNNVTRLLTGSGMGFSIAVAVFLTFNRTIWSRNDRRPVIGDLQQLFYAIFILLVLDLLILTERSIILIPMSILSVISVVFFLTIIYSVVITMIFHMENQFSSICQYRIPFAIGFIIAMMQLVILDILRFLLTGTWEGFQL